EHAPSRTPAAGRTLGLTGLGILKAVTRHSQGDSMTRLSITLACAALAMSAFAAEVPANHSDIFAKHWKTAGEYTVAIADQMPAEAYGFKPVPEEMSFAEQLVHIAQANAYFFSAVSGH